MKKIRKWILLPLILLLSGNSYGQAPSDSIYYNRLFYTCKVWGHVKYYHTEVAKGNINWDDALLDALPGIKEAPDNKSFNDSLQLMINRAGEMEVSSDALPENVDSLNNNSDYSWIQNSIFSESVKEQLEIIRNRFRPQTNVYISKNVVISFDRDTLYYSDSDYPSESMRILALYRYWNIIHYFFPYKYIMDQDWGKTLTEFIPPIIKATNALSYTLTFKKLSTRINDSHGYLSSPTLMKWEPHSYHYPPFHIRFIENETVIMHVKEEFTDVKTGDIVKKIDGIDIYTLRDSFRQYAHGSNDVFIDKQVSMMVWRGYAGSFQIKVDDGLNIKDVYPERVDYETFVGSFTPPEKSWSNTIINGDAHIGIVNLAWLLPSQVSYMMDELWETNALILDVRNYTMGTIIELADYLSETPLHIATFMIADRTFPGRFYWYNGQRIGQGTQNPYPGKLIILFDEITQSHAEYTCMGLEQIPGAVKIGSTTAGSDGNIATIYLPGKIRTNASFLGVYYPDTTPTQRVGIIPDYEVKRTIAGIKAGKDEVMEFALHLGLENSEITEESNNIRIYPNPVQNEFIFDIGFIGNVTMEIFDIHGRSLKKVQTNSSSGKIDISELKHGLYILKAISNEGIETKIIIKN